MAIYTIRAADDKGTVYQAHEIGYSKEFAEQSLPAYLEDSLIEKNGKILRRYRLHSERPIDIQTAARYEIYCPQCKTRKMEMVGRIKNAFELGEYICPVCDPQ